MDWVSRMNAAIAYIEDHMTEDIVYPEVAKVACCSAYHFQRMFSFITDVSLSEYIRRRRLTLAAFDLQGSEEKVIDVALRYGYESPEAFARAFLNLHGVTPSAARKAGTSLKTFPRLSFQLSIKGVVEMNYRMEEVGPFHVVGIQHRVKTDKAFEQVPELWRSAGETGGFDRLFEVRKADHKISGILGICANGEFGEKEEFDYILAVTSELSPPEGMVKLDFPEATWAVFDAPGAPDALQEIWRRLYTEWVPASSYELAPWPAIECYLPVEENRNELWVPVIRKQ